MKKITLSFLGVLFAFMLTATDLTGVKIYINPGHGGYNGNDRSVGTIPFPTEWTDTTGFWESSSNLTKGLELRDLLQSQNATVYMSRTDNRSGFRDNGYAGFEHIQDSSYGDRPLSVIAAEASANNVDAFLSIHS
ncbi:MAG TPA: N-acetylmuramoyl-L-alanine amidase, partial [Paludibacteraceae bacterium]|nr:N-acetylmuramoyl-L-alanine amidase [Paludibacteraceae bacterium]